MAIDFPDSPTPGQEFQGYYWDDSKQAWRSQSTNRGSVITSATTPTGATAGDMWFNTVDGTMYVYYNDGITTQWVEVQANVDNYKTPSQNYIINGGFDIWQRGTAAIDNIANAAFHPDRWFAITDGVANVNSSRIDISSQGIGSQYAWRLERTSGTNRWVAIQMAEGALSMIGKTLTLSFYLRKGSALTSNITYDISTRATKFGTTYDRSIGTILNSNLNTSTFTRFSTTFTITSATASASADLFEIEISASQAGASNAFFEIAGLQLEEGTIATPFRRNQPNIQAELAACQRYYWRFTQIDNYRWLTTAMSWGASEVVVAIKLPVTMRATPSCSISNLSAVYWLGGGANYSGATGFVSYATPETYGFYCSLTSIPGSAPYMIRPAFGTYLEASAEL